MSGEKLVYHCSPTAGIRVLEPSVTKYFGKPRQVCGGIYAKDEVLAGIRDAAAKIDAENPDHIITVGGDCLVSLAPFD